MAVKEPTQMDEKRTAKERAPRKPNGAAAAAVLAAAFGVFVMGVMTSLAEMIGASLKNSLTWHKTAGPLSGKTGVGVIAWLVAWVILHNAWKNRDQNFAKIFTISVVLLVLGWLFMFPLFFEALAK